MSFNYGKEERKWRLWKEDEEKILRECGVDEDTIEQIRIYDRADFNSNRWFYRHLNDSSAARNEQAHLANYPDENARLLNKGNSSDCSSHNGCYLCTVRPSAKETKKNPIASNKLCVPKGYWVRG